MTVDVVGSVPAIPLPHPDVESTNRVVDNTKGLYKAEPPKPTPPVGTTRRHADTKVPRIEATPPKYITKPSKLLENPAPPPPNAIPYGGGGAPTVPTSSFAMGSGTTQARLGIHGHGGRGFRLALFVVCGSGAAAHQQQLAAIDASTLACVRRRAWL